MPQVAPRNCTHLPKPLARKASVRSVGIKSCRFSPNTRQFSSSQRKITRKKTCSQVKKHTSQSARASRKSSLAEGGSGRKNVKRRGRRARAPRCHRAVAAGDGLSGHQPCVRRGRITEAGVRVGGDAPAAPSTLRHVLQDPLEKRLVWGPRQKKKIQMSLRYLWLQSRELPRACGC